MLQLETLKTIVHLIMEKRRLSSVFTNFRMPGRIFRPDCFFQIILRVLHVFSLFGSYIPTKPGWWFQNISNMFPFDHGDDLPTRFLPRSSWSRKHGTPQHIARVRQGAESLADSTELIQLLRAQRRKLRPLVATCRVDPWVSQGARSYGQCKLC